MSLAHIDISMQFNGHDDGYEPGVPAIHKRNKQRHDVPRAARTDNLEARLYAIQRAAVVAWHEEHR